MRPSSRGQFVPPKSNPGPGANPCKALWFLTVAWACVALVPLGAKADPPQAQPLPGLQSIAFGDVVVGSTASHTDTMTNHGSRNLTITQIQSSGAPFAVTGITVPVTIPPGQSLTFTAQFSPTASGAFNGTITLTSGSGHQLTESLTGTGITLYLTLTPSSLSFGNTIVGETAALSVLVTNTGTGAVTISSDSITGPGFTLADLTLPITLNPNQTTSFSVNFDPSLAGSFAGTASLVSNATDSPTVETFSGAGIHAVSLTWTASTSPGVTGYNVYRGTVSGGPYSDQLTSTPIAATSYTDTTVAAGQTYYYVATAVGTGGESSVYSNQAVATLPAPK